MGYVITGTRKHDKKSIKVFRATKSSAYKHAAKAIEFGAVNVKIKKRK